MKVVAMLTVGAGALSGMNMAPTTPKSFGITQISNQTDSLLTIPETNIRMVSNLILTTTQETTTPETTKQFGNVRNKRSTQDYYNGDGRLIKDQYVRVDFKCTENTIVLYGGEFFDGDGNEITTSYPNKDKTFLVSALIPKGVKGPVTIRSCARFFLGWWGHCSKKVEVDFSKKDPYVVFASWSGQSIW